MKDIIQYWKESNIDKNITIKDLKEELEAIDKAIKKGDFKPLKFNDSKRK